ncbi:helix-turn-helix domain-containing protein [Occultella aeris]|uniref:Anaerobic benzoate catabolism transcriptional regulator n=1 Tax=Occultella aeris TaxID=2761496 RepID=A0A7M4DRD7_9MICO|nr:XRE family transcriptional regulator [Occultella aeris]VZO40031.1 anaerobic benzoate catabolism transcriptional regulator [Occultella aeris]
MTLSDDELAVSAIGQTVRAGRKRLGLSVQQFADRADVSLGLVSTLERGHGNPSLHTLRRLAAVLGVGVADLLEPALEDVGVVRAADRHRLPVRDGAESQRVVRELLTPRGETRLQVIRSTLPVGFSNEAQPFRHLATESITVESGRLLLAHGDRRETLEPGDSATYGCETPHWWANVADTPTVVLGAVTASER